MAKVKTVTVEALQVHTYNGQTFQPGDTYEIDEQYADSVRVQGKAKRVDEPAAEKPERPSPDRKSSDKPGSHPVEPMKLGRKDVEASKR